jgi:hypothetical protein
MLFLGGLNSILPYIIYLSLIWICLIIGFTGKIGGMMHLLAPKASLVDQFEPQQYDSKVIQCIEFSTKEKVKKEAFVPPPEPGIFQIPIINCCKQYIDIDSFFNIHLINAIRFRGPPQSVS